MKPRGSHEEAPGKWVLFVAPEVKVVAQEAKVRVLLSPFEVSRSRLHASSLQILVQEFTFL